MIKKAVCDKCGREFIEVVEDGIVNNIAKECLEHELVEHFNVNKTFETELVKAISKLDSVYNTTTKYEFKDVSVYENYYNGIEKIEYTFKIENEKIKSKEVDIVIYENYTIVPTSEKISKIIEKHFKSSVKKYYEGVVEFEEWCGGNGADDYVLDGDYMNSILRELLGKKIRILVLD